MKKFYSILTATLLFGTAIPAATAAVEVSVDFFHDNLEAFGDWREVGDYGYCWQPRDVGRDWRPYNDGHWLYTDAGWTWDSEEPYSWAVYHYGRWTRLDEVGWVWVPGTEWGPAWVSWRRSPEYVGWAPLPPEARFDVSIGFNGRVDADFDIGPTNYSFVEVRNFGAPRLRSVLVEPRRNITIINQTTNITKITYVNNVVYNGGPRYEDISRESAQPIRRLKLERREELGGDPRSLRAEQLHSRVEGDSLHVMAPTFDKKPATAPKKVAAKVEKAQVDRGWKDAGPPAEVAKAREKIKSEPATAAEPSSQPKTTRADEPAVAPVTPPAPGEKPGKGKMRKGDQPPVATVPGTTAAPSSATETPLTPNQPPNPGKHAPGEKAIKPEVHGERPVPTPIDEPVPGARPQKGDKKGNLAQPPPEVQPREPAPAPAPERRPKPENAEPPRNPAPPEGQSPQEKLQLGRKEPQPRSEPPNDRRPERPAPPEKPSQAARPESRPPPPGAGRPQAPESEKGKGKEKGKDKDDKKPE